jgi:hypothetical protein
MKEILKRNSLNSQDTINLWPDKNIIICCTAKIILKNSGLTIKRKNTIWRSFRIKTRLSLSSGMKWVNLRVSSKRWMIILKNKELKSEKWSQQSQRAELMSELIKDRYSSAKKQTFPR